MARWRVRRALFVAALLATMLSACARSERHRIEMRGFEFEPAQLAAQVGDTIEFVNRDLVPHTATAQDGTWDSGEVGANQGWTWIVSKRGTLSYICALHTSMTGTIDVR